MLWSISGRFVRITEGWIMSKHAGTLGVFKGDDVPEHIKRRPVVIPKVAPYGGHHAGRRRLRGEVQGR